MLLKSTSSGNAEPYARQKMKASTGGGEGTTPVTTACPEDRSYELGCNLQSDDRKMRKKEKSVAL